MLQKLFGPSFKTTVGGIILFIGGLGAIVSHTAIGGTPVGLTIETISEVAALLGAAFGFASAKDKNVSNSPTPLATAQTIPPAPKP